jgi:type IV pilus assembly protein PilY1
VQTHSRLQRAIVWIAITAFWSTNALPSPVDLANSPLVTGIGKTVSPNIFFILDDSLSMNSQFMPDSVDEDNDSDGNNDYSAQKRPCTLNFGYNTIYYNPNTTYVPPKTSTGTSYANATFTGAWTNGFNTGAGTVDLSATTPVMGPVTVGPTTLPTSNPIATTNGSRTITITHTSHGRSGGDQVTLSGVTGSGSPATVRGIPITSINGQTFTISNTGLTANTYRITISGSPSAASSAGTGGGSSVKATYTYTGVVGSTPNYYYYSYTAGVSPYTTASPPSTCETNASYTKVDVATLTAAQKTNFANWYSYYRTRLLMMKTASGRAFVGLSDQYRVGFTTISEKSTGASKFLDIKKFGTTHKSDWFTKLYGISGASYTPLRGALSKAGRYYAGMLDTAGDGSHDPIQYSCQKNFTILTTDGFWNSNDESPTSDSGTIGAATANYGPFKMDNLTRVGDQDGVAGVVAPFVDSSAKANSLADVAYYYYNTDLRPTAGALGGVTDESTRLDVSTNNVPTLNSDPAAHQHMTTFTLGLGVDGILANPGDYAAILAGSKNWPDPITSTTPGSIRESRRIDDLWHAAVNGHGTTSNGGNLSAKNPDAVVSELSTALQAIQAVVGSSSAAATSNLQPVDGDNTAFIAQYKTVAWTGDLVARVIDVVTGAIPATNTWSAQTLLDTQSSRNIYTFSAAAGDSSTKLRAFEPSKLTTEITAGYFKSDSGNPGGALAQYAGWTASQQSAATQNAMIDFIRGVRDNEGTGTGITQLFREREHVLGDIVSAAPVFVRKPPFAYTDTGYAAYVASSAITNRAATVYVGANDGMLHAFDGTTGQSNSGHERWAYIPSMVVKNLYKLAASDYSLNHRFYVDGPITAGDAYNDTSSSWATILVGGLGGGGKGYYALDVTNPTSPKALWEFGTASDYSGDVSYDADMGNSYGNPVITKRASDGKWVVIFASGYNNTSGDKKGRLYVVDAFTGQKLSEIITTTAANEDLSGIARVSNFVSDGLRDNSTKYVYAGDLSGALWRFDITTDTALHLADTSSTAGNQPIMVQPELARIRVGSNNYTVIYFGTGRFLGPNDLSTSAPSSAVAQAIYAVKDTGTYLGVLTDSGANLVAQTLDSSVSPRTSSNNAVDWTTDNGWYVTTPVGERFNIDPGLQLGTLVIAANIPATDYCKPTGSSVLYQLNYRSGFVLKTREFQAQVVGNTQLQLGGSGSGAGNVYGGKVGVVSVLADGTTITTDAGGGGGTGTATRVSWREIE